MATPDYRTLDRINENRPYTCERTLLKMLKCSD